MLEKEFPGNGGGRITRAFILILAEEDQFTRECPAIKVDTSTTGQRVVWVLDRLSETHGLRQVLEMDYGPGFTSKASGLGLSAAGKTAQHYTWQTDVSQKAVKDVGKPL